MTNQTNITVYMQQIQSYNHKLSPKLYIYRPKIFYQSFHRSSFSRFYSRTDIPRGYSV